MKQRLVFLFLLYSASIPELGMAKTFIMLYSIKQLLFEYFFTAVSGEEQNEVAGPGAGTDLIGFLYLRIHNTKSKTFQSIASDSIRS